MRITDAERLKYEEIHSIPEYGEQSPGVVNVRRFLDTISVEEQGHSILDIGCGTGAAGLLFQDEGFSVRWWDITDQALDERIPRAHFFMGALWENVGWKRFNWGFCCDVMEHIPPQFTMLVVSNLLGACDRIWFHISCVPDNWGKVIGQPLHLTVQPFVWWRDSLREICEIEDARDLCGSALFVVRRKDARSARNGANSKVA